MDQRGSRRQDPEVFGEMMGALPMNLLVERETMSGVRVFVLSSAARAARRLAWASSLVLLGGCITMTEGGGESTYTTREQVFNTVVLDSSLKRGTSTKKDVEQAPGRPGGFGPCFLPTDSEPKTV